MHSTDPLFDPAMRALPPVFVVRLPSGPAAGWVQASIDYALADAAPPSNRSPSADRDAAARARAHRGAAGPPRHRPGHRPRMDRRPPRSGPGPGARRCCTRTRPGAGRSPTLAAASPRPARPSTTASARSSASHRSATSPRGACTSPTSCSATTELSVFTIARRVGYDAEEAFSRAFKHASAACRRASAEPQPDTRDEPVTSRAPLPGGKSLTTTKRTTGCRHPIEIMRGRTWNSHVRNNAGMLGVAAQRRLVRWTGGRRR